jgi:hypothetical protein
VIDLYSDLVLRARKPGLEPEANYIRSLLEKATLVRVQPIADYLYLGTDQENWYLTKDFPNIAPPWPVMFASWKEPRKSFSEGKIIDRTEHVKDLEVGCLMEAVDITGITNRSPVIPANARWSTSYTVFIRHRELLNISWQTASFFVNADGSYAGIESTETDKHQFAITPASLWPECEHDMSQRRGFDFIPMLFPVLLAISFCHCKNVTVRREEVPAGLYKKRMRSHGFSPKVWHEIEIEPMRKVMRSVHAEGAGNEASETMRILKQRGHFKDYTDGRGLFGKHHGLYWWEAKQTLGVSYQVNPPSGA